jgi:20S proteasome alpha/beta subunit
MLDHPSILRKHIPDENYPPPQKVSEQAGQMTIAIGMVCTDGVLIGADTRHTVAGECVWEDSKMTKGSSARFGDYVMAGCGNTSYIYMAFDNIEKALGNPRNAKRDLSELIQKETVKIHKHINDCYNPSQALPWLELIIGIHKKAAEPILIHVENTGAVTPVTNKVFMGSGRPIAVAFARIVLAERLPLKLARLAAFFFMYQAKESGYATGGDTQFCYLPRPKSMGLWDDKEMAEQVEKIMRLSLLDARNCTMPQEQFDGKFRDVFQEVLAIRRSSCPKPTPKD